MCLILNNNKVNNVDCFVHNNQDEKKRNVAILIVFSTTGKL